MGDDVVTEDIHILLDGRTQIFHKVLTVLHKVRIDVILQTTDTVVVLDQATTGGLLHAVEHMLTIAHTIEHTSEGAEVLSHTRGVEQVGIETLQLIHNRTDILDAIGQFYLHGLLNHTYQSMAMLHGSQIVKAIC